MEQRQTFRFRLPWLQAPEPAPAASRPSQTTQAPSHPATPVQRHPSRPQGAAQATPPAPSMMAEPRPSSLPRSRTVSQSTTRLVTQPVVEQAPKAPAATPSRAVLETQVTSRTASPAGRNSQHQQVTQVLHKSATPPRGATQPDTSPSSPASLQKLALEVKQEANSLPTLKKPAATVLSESKKEPRKQEASQKSRMKSQTQTTAPPLEKLVSTLEGQKKEVASEKKMLKASWPPVPESDSELLSGKEIDGMASGGPAEMVKGVYHEEPKQKAITETQTTSLKEPIGQPTAEQDEQDQHSKEDVVGRKEILETFEKNGRNAESKNRGHESTVRYNHTHTMTEGNASMDKTIEENSGKILHKQGARPEKHAFSETPFSIITLAGENIGAKMHLSSEPSAREKSIHIHRGYKTNPDEKIKTIVDGEGSSISRESKDTKVQDEPGTKLLANNNAQGINNSLIFNSSVTEGNPGVQVVFPHKPVEPLKTKEEKLKPETRRAEVNSTPAERIAYAPNTRRRCLRGLFMESSDSDADNSQKRTRHGCRVVCNQKSKDNILDAL